MKRNELLNAGVLLRLQRRYGNRFVGKVIDRLRNGDQPRDSLASARRSIDRNEQVAKRIASTLEIVNGAGSAPADAFPSALQRQGGGGGLSNALPTILQRVTQILPDNASFITLDGTATRSKVAGEATEPVPKAFPKQGQDGVAVELAPVTQSRDSAIHGNIVLTINAKWKIHGPLSNVPIVGILPAVGDSTGEGQLVIDTPFRVLKTKKIKDDSKDDDDDTVVKNKSPRLARQRSSGSGAALDSQPALSADADDNGLSVTASPRVTFQSQVASQLSTNNPPLIPNVSAQTQIPNTQAFGSDFTVTLPVNKTPPLSPPADHDYHCTRAGRLDQEAPGFGPFIVASDQFAKPDDARQDIHDWYFGLEPNVRQNLEEGKGILRVTGRASRTGSRTFNLDLAERRAKKVRGIIADFAGSNAHLNSFALGEFGAQTPDNKEDANERRVDVQIDGTVPGEQAAKMQGDDCSGHLGQTTPTGPIGPVVNPPEPSVPD